MFSIWNCHWKKWVRDYIVSLSKSTSMWVGTFSINLSDNIRNQDPVFTILLGCFNARSNRWWIYNITDKNGTQIESIISLCDISQPISQSTHILQNSSSWIDLIFKDQPNLVINSEEKAPLHENCHHQITYTKLNLQIMYPPPIRKACLRLQKCQRKLNPKGFKYNWLE